MKQRLTHLALYSLLLPSSLGWASSLTTYITNGGATSTTTHPDFVSIGMDSMQYGGSRYSGELCGGTMLDDTHVLTAAHCLFTEDGELDVSNIMYYVIGQADDESDFPNQIITSRAKAFYFFDSFSNSESDLWENDIAVIELESPLNVADYVQRTVPTYRDENNQFVAIGHGLTEDLDGDGREDDGDALLQTSLTYVDNNTCANSTPSLNGLHDTQLCFTGDTNVEGYSSGICSGDSGGPVYWDSGSGFYQVGITSFGPTECGKGLGTANITGVFTEISQYSGWIDNVLSDTNSSRANCVITDNDRYDYFTVNGATVCGQTVSSFNERTFESNDESHSELSASSGGGGSVPLTGSLFLGLLAWFRTRKRG